MPAPLIDYGECLRDSPRFRQQLGQNEESLEELESRMEKLLKLCGAMVEGGRAWVAQQAQFQAGLWELSAHFATDQEAETTENLNRMIQSLQEVTKFQNILLDQANKCISKNLTVFLREDMKQMKETKGYFNKISNDLDSALSKNAAASKCRPGDIEDASNLLTATRSCFRYTGMDYVYQISMLQKRKKHVVLDALSSFMGGYSSFFRQGTNVFTDTDPFLSQLNKNIQGMRDSCQALEKQLEKRHTYVTQSDLQSFNAASEAAEKKEGKRGGIEGYLFKRGQNAFRTWNRRWFYLSNNKLCYSRRNGEDVTVMEEDLRICLVRPLTDGDRRFCFEVISPTKSHVLQADSEEMYGVWLTSLQQGISGALHDMMEGGSPSQDSSIVWEDSDTEEAQDSKGGKARGGGVGRNAMQLVEIPGNELCADCNAEGPQWASINFGVTLCIECGGIHRGLGVHVSKVRSITLDTWEPEILKVMAELGNSIVNRILEADTGGRDKPRPDAMRAIREIYIGEKYRDKKFVNRAVFESSEAREAESWTVKRLRRRTRKKKKVNKALEGKEALDKEEKEVDTAVEEEEGSILESVLRASTLGPVTKVLNAEVCLFGGSLGKHHVTSMELDSDQESTDGEGEMSWVAPCDRRALLSPELLLFRAAAAHNLPVMCQAVALGADLEWRNANEDGKAAIHQSILSGSVMACEFLILNSVRIDAVDAHGNSALHMAAKQGNTGQVCLLLKHHADHHLKNLEGQEPLDIAVAAADADIVTLLRLAALNEEIREADMTLHDDTFNDVVQEFSRMVYTHPERLQKK